MALFFNDKNRFYLLLVSTVLYLFASSISESCAALSIDEEKKLGKEFYEKLSKANLISTNSKARDYISRLGGLILSNSDKAPFDFTFSLVKSSAVNAFATPGGYVYLNEGLVTLVENESQLAGVLAHEIAHVNGRHISETLEKSQKLNLSALVAILAGAFLGGSGETAAAVTSFSVAAATSLSLKYSREQEESADRMGMSYLTKAGYNGRGMLDFLRIMRRYEYYSNTIPSYFLTHPGTDDRIRYIDSLLQTTYKDNGTDNIYGELRRIQTLLVLESSREEAAKMQHFQKLLATNPIDPDALYGLAVAQERLGLISASDESFHKAMYYSPNDPDILRDFGISKFKRGQFAVALPMLQQSYKLNESDRTTVFYLGRCLESLGNIHEALEFFKKYEAVNRDDVEILYHIAMAYGKLNNDGESHYYFGLYFKKKGKKEIALLHFNTALKRYETDSRRYEDILKEIESLKH